MNNTASEFEPEDCVTVDGELLRSEAKRDGLALVDEALAWKQQFQAKGWL